MIDFNFLNDREGVITRAKIGNQTYMPSKTVFTTLSFEVDGSLNLTGSRTVTFKNMQEIEIGISRTLTGSWIQNAYWTLFQVSDSEVGTEVFAVRSLRLFLDVLDWYEKLDKPVFKLVNDFSETAYTSAENFRALEDTLNNDIKFGYNQVYESKGYPDYMPLIFRLART